MIFFPRPITVGAFATKRAPGNCWLIHLLVFEIVDGGRAFRRVYDGLLLDAGGTLLQLAKPVETTYADIGRKYGWFLRFLLFIWLLKL